MNCHSKTLTISANATIKPSHPFASDYRPTFLPGFRGRKHAQRSFLEEKGRRWRTCDWANKDKLLHVRPTYIAYPGFTRMQVRAGLKSKLARIVLNFFHQGQTRLGTECGIFFFCQSMKPTGQASSKHSQSRLLLLAKVVIQSFRIQSSAAANLVM